MPRSTLVLQVAGQVVFLCIINNGDLVSTDLSLGKENVNHAELDTFPVAPDTHSLDGVGLRAGIVDPDTPVADGSGVFSALECSMFASC